MIILCGKTCTGKSTIQKEIEKLGIPKIVTYTTRPKRPHEKNGVDYNFVSEEKFMTLKNDGFFVETSGYEVIDNDGVSHKQHYGSAFIDYQKDRVIVLNPEGLRHVKALNSIQPVVFYLMADENILWNRLRKRGDNAMEARRRLNTDNIDFSGINSYIDFALRTDLNMSPKYIAETIVHLYRKVTDENYNYSVSHNHSI